jgi:formamidopyrimidine-DNA glycosylase
MPELPEVETIMTIVKRRVENKKIKKTKVINPKLRWPIETRKVKNLENKTIISVLRRGKYLVFKFKSQEQVLIIHLGMTGIITFKKIEDYEINKHDHLLMYFSDFIFIFNDVRKFGSIHISNEFEKMFLIKNLGVEPLSSDFDTEYLYELSKKRSCTIKEFIMNQKIVVGVGNIYATEVLFLSKIHPAMRTNELTFLRCKKLVSNIKSILSKAIKMGGTTIKDYMNADGKPGYFSQELLIYQKDTCPIHKKNKVSNIKISGRASYFCDKCQIE